MARRVPPTEDRLLTQADACRRLTISPRRFHTYFRRFEVLRKGIVPLEPILGGEIQYRVRMSAIVAHLEQLARGQHSTVKPAPEACPKRNRTAPRPPGRDAK